MLAEIQTPVTNAYSGYVECEITHSRIRELNFQKTQPNDHVMIKRLHHILSPRLNHPSHFSNAVSQSEKFRL